MLFVAFVAAASIFFWLSRSWLRVWLTGKTLDELYKLLDWALWAVIVGVVVEEWALIWKGCKFTRLAWSGEYATAFKKAWKHKGELAESVGFIVLTVGLAGELALDPLIETRQKADQAEAASELAATQQQEAAAEGRIADAKSEAAKANVDAGKANERAAALEKAAADANERAAHLEAENLKLEAEIAPRRIDQNGRINFDPSLARFNGTTVRVYSYSGDVESAVLASELVRFFTDTGSPVRMNVQNCILTQVAAGALALGVHVTGKNSDFVAALTKFFSDKQLATSNAEAPMGVMSYGCGFPSPPEETIFVGAKTPGVLTIYCAKYIITKTFAS